MTEDPRFTAAIDLMGRLGASSFQIRYSDDEEPTVWFAVAMFDDGRWVVDAGRTPHDAIIRLCERLIDGGECLHCHKVCAFDSTFDNEFLDDVMCWTSYDPELKTYRRSCAGEPDVDAVPGETDDEARARRRDYYRRAMGQS